MNTRNKLMTIMLMSIAVIGFGAYFYHLQMSSDQRLYADVEVQTYNSEREIIAPFIAPPSQSKTRGKAVLQHSDNFTLPSQSGNNMNRVIGESKVMSHYSTGIGKNNYAERKKDENIYAYQTLALSAPAYSIKSRHGGGVSGGGAASSNVNLSGSVQPPHAAPYTTDNSTIAMDPGLEPEANSRIPVGNGGYILLLLSLLYGAAMFVNRNLRF